MLPYCLSGGTDNKALSKLGITGYGFAPLRLPADLDFAPMFHGIDERVPVEPSVRRPRPAAARADLLSAGHAQAVRVDPDDRAGATRSACTPPT